MQSIIKWLYSWHFELFGIEFSTDNLSKTITSMCDFNEVQKNALWKMGTILNGYVIPVGTSLLTLFFMISFIKTVQEGVEKITWERVTFKGIIFYVLHFAIVNSYEISKVILNIMNKTFETLQGRMLVYMGKNKSLGVASMLNDIIEKADFIDSIMYFAVFLILAIPFTATIIMIFTQVFTRIVKLMCCITFAPIPIAMAVEGDTFRGKAISYLTYTAAIGCEAILIYVGLYVYTLGFKEIAGINGPITTVIALLFLNGIFSAVISFGSQFCEKLFGRW